MPNVVLLLAQIVVVLIVARLAGTFLQRLGQPRVVGEMMAGIALGPSLFGKFAPAASAALFPVQSLGFLSTLSQLGLILFMFLVGLELDTDAIKARGRSALVISHASIVAPFVLGAALALWLYPRLSDSSVQFSAFALFLGAAMSVTAFPVLARILSERNLVRTPLGALAITCAAVDDVTAWMLLAGVVALARSGTADSSLWFTLGGTVLYVGVMVTVGRRILSTLGNGVSPDGTMTQSGLAAVIIVVLTSAGITELLGIHALFGAFLAGVVMPKDERFIRALAMRFEDLMLALLLPLFFAFTGLRTQLGWIGGGHGEEWLALGLVLAVAVIGKFGGCAIAARLSGLSWRESGALGALMNTRGLMELVILNIGLDIGVISPALFAMMVVMAITTTLMTTPLVTRLTRELPVPVARARTPAAVGPLG
jgi:Kef-type K+ transport system membrane component KefB